MNESKTEIIVRDYLRSNGYYSKDIVVAEKASDSEKIKKLLKNASKNGIKGGYPEFIITSKTNTDFLIVIECKADAKNHESESRDNYAKYAVDGVLLYASFLAKEYNVLAIAVSGESKKDLKISHFLQLKETEKAYPKFDDKILPFSNYYNAFSESDIKFNQDYKRLLDYTRNLNETLHKIKIKESDRSLLISGMLIALKNPAFANGYRKYKTLQQLLKALVNTIIDEITEAKLPTDKITNLQHAFSFIVTQDTLIPDKEFFENLIEEIDQNINGFVKTYQYYDTVGQFYIEFLSYANNDKGLGIVLTPPHITELFVELAGVNKDSIVYDNCCGTCGFLISAMKRMIDDANDNEKKIANIQQKQLIGIECQNNIYALAVSNMIVHGDGKTNVLFGDCFKLTDEIKRKYKPTVGLLNPPYKSKGVEIEELDFILNNLEVLQRGGKCVAIIPISSVLQDTGRCFDLKQQLMKKHTVEAVMSMPPELFHNSDVGVVTCAVVVTAHIPHPHDKETWLGYWRNDGFIKVKKKGRIDVHNTWEKIKNKWVTAYNNKKVIAGFSVMKKLKPEDEWCAEAYMKTDYSVIKDADFISSLKKYAAFKILHEA